MLSGIGPKAELDKFGIKSLVDLPVGSNLYVASVFSLNFKLKDPSRCQAMGHPEFNNPRFFDSPLPSDWAATVAMSEEEYQKAAEVDRVQFKAGLNRNDYEVTIAYSPNPAITDPPGTIDGSYISVFIMFLSVRSKGALTLASKDIKDFPSIDP